MTIREAVAIVVAVAERLCYLRKHAGQTPLEREQE